MNDEKKTRGWTAELLRGTALLLLLALVFLPTSAHAATPTRLIPVGKAVGIKLFSDGVVVVGTSEVMGENGAADPAGQCGLREGDVITHINATEVDSIEEVEALLQQLEGEPMSIRATRGEKQVQLTARAVFSPADGCYKLGAWIRDSMAGIGTVTYYDPDSGAFGALGHGINDVDTALLMPLESGSILPATVTGVRRGEAGTPGQLKGSFLPATLGTLAGNTAQGIFGTLDGADWVRGEALPVADKSEVVCGPAVIRSNVSGDTVEEYAVEITRLCAGGAGDCRDFMLTVTDPRLLSATGGIVQGMSGSPIIQNGKLIGAVTHVLVNDPQTGYGIFIENMLEAAS